MSYNNENIDLNINHYTNEELIELLNLEQPITKEEIKRCEEDPTLQLKLNKSLPVKITKLYLTKKKKNLLPGAIKWLKLALPSIKDEIIMSTLNITKTQLQAQLKRCINDVEPINPLECKLCLFTDLPDEIKNILKT